MAASQPVRGTHDLLPDAMAKHRLIGDVAMREAERSGFAEVATPIIEFSGVFERTLGETSDVVSKEMFRVESRGDEQITMRPENTAGVARMVLSHGLLQQAPLKYFYRGPMFRRERPQKGRQRQFHQIGVELIGVPGPLADVEVIAVGARILDRLGIRDRTVLELNTLGDTASRQAYREALITYFSARKNDLSEDSLSRLDRNPLRILDSKDAGDREIVAGAPEFAEHLNQDSQDFFARVRDGLAALDVPYTLNPRLVRGLDYYCHTAFEFTTDALGAQSAVLAGGRYDGLIGTMGGPETPGVGWAAGMERLALLTEVDVAPPRPIAVIPVGGDSERLALQLTERLRKAGRIVDLGYSGNLGRRMKRANRIAARLAIIIGEDELARGVATVRDLDSGDQSEAALDGLEAHLTAHVGDGD